MRIGSLCSGYEGLGMAVEAVFPDASLAWVSDIDKGACKVLAHRYPDVPNIGDMTTVDWAAVEPVDVITGGTPCQDLSHAGKRAGMTEGTRSNLWVAMREAIATIRPSLVIWENVGGAYSAAADSEMESRAGCVGDRPGGPVLRALGRVLGDLASLGYVGGWHGLRAADVGAPHGRLRVFVVATDAQRGGLNGWAPDTLGRPLGGVAAARGGEGSRAGVRLLKTPTSQLAVNGGSQHPDKRKAGGHGPTLADEVEHLLPTPTTMDSASSGGGYNGQANVTLTDAVARQGAPHVPQWGDYAAAIARWEHTLGRPAPAPTMTSTKGNPQLSPAFTEWMMGLPHGWITDTPGITRNEALKLCGNGVVPQQAEAAIRFLLSVIRQEVAA